MTNKVFVLGVDGGTFNLIKPWAEEGSLPNFRKIMSEGVYGKLRSSIPPITVPAWPSMYTGKNPGKLGIFFFGEIDENYKERFFNLSDLKSTKFWTYFKDKKVGLVNCSLTFPPEKVNGFMITPIQEGKEYVYPKKLKNKIPKEYETLSRNPSKVSTSEHVENMIMRTIGIEKTIKYLLKNEKWDCFFSVIETTDTTQHKMYQYMFPEVVGEKKHKKWGNSIKNIYKLIDDFLGELIKLKNTNILIVSDHGFGFWDLNKPQKIFHVNDWLKKEGWLKTKSSFRDKIFRLFSKFGITKMKVHEFFRSFGFDLRRIKILNEKIIQKERLVTSKVDFSETKAFLSIMYSGFGGLRINLRGREKNGQVSKEEYNKFRDEVIKKLKNLTDPEMKRKVIKNVWKREEIYKGEFLDKAPDIVFQCSKNYDTKRILEGRLFSDVKVLMGFHEQDGIFMAYGPDIKKGYKIKDTEIIDIAPTLLHMNAIPVPKDMDGNVLKGIFNKKSELKKKVKYQKPLKKKFGRKYKISAEDEGKIRERLKGLGYLE